MTTFLSFLAYCIGVLVFSFASWRRLKDDYHHDQIFSTTLTSLFGGGFVWYLFEQWLPRYSYWGFLIGFVIFLIYSMRRFDLKIFELFDGFSIGLFWLAFFTGLGILIRYGWGEGYHRLLWLIPPIVSIAAYWFFAKRYRRFFWYPSGKIGFVGVMSMAIYFGLNSLVAFYSFWVVSFRDQLVTGIVCWLVLLTFLGTIYLRSGRRKAENILLKFKRRKRR